MKFAALLMIGFAAVLPMNALAQDRERQIYSPYPEPPLRSDQVAQIQYQYEQQEIGTLRVYPGREIYGNNYGPIPRHPGDYRDAVDRGSWVGGGIAKPGFNRY